MTILHEARALAGRLIELRRAIHRRPEIGLHLPTTQAAIVESLSRLPLEVHRGRELTSVIAVLHGSSPGPTVLLRADMDALPLTETSGESFAAESPNAMHACGHDLHCAIVVGAAHLLAARRQELPGSVVFAWQPGEEGYDGMSRMLAEGLLEATGQHPVATYGLHALAHQIPHGVFATKAGVTHSATASFKVIVRGTGGSGAFPHTTRDPLPVSAEIITAIQTFVTRQFDVFDPVVLSFGSIHGGGASNVIPEQIELTGTARTFSDRSMQEVEAGLRRITEGIAAAHGLRADIEYEHGYPPVVNDTGEVELFAETVRNLLGESCYQPLSAPIAAGDDYARVLAEVPGAFVMFGAGIEHNGQSASNHSPQVRFDDSLIPDCAAVLAEVALTRLRREAAAEPHPRSSQQPRKAA